VDDGRVVRAVQEYLALLEAGQKPDRAAFTARYPDFAAILTECLAGLDFVQAVAPQLSNPVAVPLASETVPSGGTLGDFRILREVGRGGMGIVYEAEQISLGRHVALKVLPFAATMDPRQLQRFQNEARAAASLQHPHIVPVHAVGCERGVHYYAMQFIDGQSLAELIGELKKAKGSNHRGTEDTEKKQQTAVSSLCSLCLCGSKDFFKTIAELGIQAAEALEHAHSVGIVHRDIKPANLMIDAQGQLWITDFGLARTAADAGLTMTGDVLGTLRYMSPEQALARHGLVDHRTDIYSLGVTLYELLTGTPAVGGKDREQILNAITLEEPQPPRALDAAIPGDLDTILLKALAKEPAERYATARELADDLRRYQADRPIRAKRPTAWQRLRKWGRRHRVLVGATVAVLCIAFVAMVVSSLFIWSARNEALLQRDAADRMREVAEHREAELRQHNYVAEIKLAFQAWQNNHEDLLENLLSRHVPQADLEDLRGWEWHYLRQFAHTPAILRGHSDAVYHIAYSPDGNWIATASKDKTIKLWESATGMLVRTISGHGSEVNCVAFSPDGTTLASASEDRTVRLWEVATGQPEGILWKHTHEVVGVEISPDGRLIAAGANDGTVIIWNQASGAVRAKFRAHEKRVESLAFALGGKALLTCGAKSAKLWDLAGLHGSDLPAWSVHDGPLPVLHQEVAPYSLLAAVLTPDGDYLAAGGDANELNVWNLRSGRHSVVVIPSHIQGMAISSYGRQLAFGGMDHRMGLYDLPTGQLKVFESPSKIVWGMAFSPDGNEFASASSDGTVRRRPLTQRYLPLDRFAKVNALAFAPNGEVLATNHTDGSVCLWDAATRQLLRKLPVTVNPPEIWGMGNSLAFSPDSRSLLVGVVQGNPGIWDTATGRLLARLSGPAEDQTAVGWSSDGNTIVIGPGKEPGTGVYRLYDAKSLQPGRRLEFPMTMSRLPVALSPDGKIVVAGGYEPALDRALLARWRLDFGQQCETEDAGRGGTHFLAIAPDGRFLASATTQGSIRVWDCQSGRPLVTLAGHNKNATGVCFAPDGKTLASAGHFDHTVRLWNVATGSELFTFETGQAYPAFPAFSADGKRLAVYCHWGEPPVSEVCIWSIDSPALR
jgi:WD40 repeat protein/serine/threonine protein kinase